MTITIVTLDGRLSELKPYLIKGLIREVETTNKLYFFMKGIIFQLDRIGYYIYAHQIFPIDTYGIELRHLRSQSGRSPFLKNLGLMISDWSV
jgi:hypothetical protein